MMTFSDFTSALQAIIDILLEWLECVRHPFLACERLLAKRQSEQARVKQAMKIWLSSFIIGTVTLLAVYNTVGLGLGSVGFHLSVFLFVTLALLLASGVIHVGLRWDGVESQFGETLLIYTMFFGTFLPLFWLLGHPGLATILAIIKASKAHGLGFWATTTAVSKTLSALSPQTGMLIQASNALTSIAALALSGMFADVVALYYRTDRQRILSSMSFSIVVLGLVPCFICIMLYYYALFSFV